MATTAAHRAVSPSLAFDSRQLMREQGAIDAARRAPQRDAVAPTVHWREDIVALLKGSLTSEMMCVLHYKWRRCEADGQDAQDIADESQAQSGEFSHAVRLAQRIVQLGGKPDFMPDAHGRRSHAGYSDSTDLIQSVQANLAVARAAVARYCEIIRLIDGQGWTAPLLLQEILADEEVHAIELEYWLAH